MMQNKNNNLKKQKTTKIFNILPQDVLLIIFEYWSILYRFKTIRKVNKFFDTMVRHDYFWRYKRSRLYNTAKSLYMLIKKYGKTFMLNEQYYHRSKLIVFKQFVKQVSTFEDLWKTLHKDDFLTNKYGFFYFLLKEFNELLILKLKQFDNTHLKKLKFGLRKHEMYYVLATNPKNYSSFILSIHNIEFDVLSWNKKTYGEVVNTLKKKKEKLNTIRFPFWFKGFDDQMSDNKIFESIAQPLLGIDLTKIRNPNILLDYKNQIIEIINNRLKQIAEFIEKNTTVLIYPHAAFKFVYTHCNLSPIIKKMRITNASYCEMIDSWKISENKFKNNKVTTVKGSGDHLNSQKSIHRLKKYFKNLNKIIVKHGRYSDIAKILKAALIKGIDTVEFLYISSNNSPKKNFSSMRSTLSNIINYFFVEKNVTYHSKKPFKIISENNSIIRSTREKEIIKILKKFNDDFNRHLKEQQEPYPNQNYFNNFMPNFVYVLPNQLEPYTFYNQYPEPYTFYNQYPEPYTFYNQYPEPYTFYNQYAHDYININQQNEGRQLPQISKKKKVKKKTKENNLIIGENSNSCFFTPLFDNKQNTNIHNGANNFKPY
ncbi:MAG: hypothetical protein PVG30_02640 [Gammaproteobacteria bacterium]|jgi:hypothetical protein